MAAPVYYVSPGQINFEIPISAAIGDGTVQVVRNNQIGNPSGLPRHPPQEWPHPSAPRQ
ncbi:MAG: hypothetical protein ACLQRH_12865 [Acidimicrobiales bacterium]